MKRTDRLTPLRLRLAADLLEAGLELTGLTREEANRAATAVRRRGVECHMPTQCPDTETWTVRPASKRERAS